ncbi:MAG: glutamate--tRNA ligase family protein [Flavobacteriales bacterium]
MALTKIPPRGRTRLAPTPSGFLHVGNAFNFLVSALLAKDSGSDLLLRIDDLDTERVRSEYVEDIFRSLEWLGIRCDKGPSGPEELATTWSQAHRLDRYRGLSQQLERMGMLYPCACSRSEMAERVETGAPHACASTTSPTVTPGSPWRLRIPDPSVVRYKELSGRTVENDLFALMEDPVLITRGNGRPAYQLASLADDVDFGITFIVRGEDLRPSTTCQAFLADRLGLDDFAEVRFHHHHLIVDADGSKLSKSAGSRALRSMRLAGEGPDQLVGQAERYVEDLYRSIST